MVENKGESTLDIGHNQQMMPIDKRSVTRFEVLTANEALRVSFEDVQDIQIFKEKVQRAKSFLEHNISVIDSVRSLNKRLKNRCSQKSTDESKFEDVDIVLEGI